VRLQTQRRCCLGACCRDDGGCLLFLHGCFPCQHASCGCGVAAADGGDEDARKLSVFRAVLSRYCGTHSFHNYTKRAVYRAQSAADKMPKRLLERRDGYRWDSKNNWAVQVTQEGEGRASSTPPAVAATEEAGEGCLHPRLLSSAPVHGLLCIDFSCDLHAYHSYHVRVSGRLANPQNLMSMPPLSHR
jgi:hypothetical protein